MEKFLSSDVLSSRRFHDGPKIHFLVQDNIRHRFLFDWITQRHPKIWKRFRVNLVTSQLAEMCDDVGLLVTWLQDPLRERTPEIYARVRRIEKQHERKGIRTINNADALSNAIKSRALRLLGEAGFLCARSVPLYPPPSFDEVVATTGKPFIVRKDRGHGLPIHLVETEAQYRSIDLAKPPKMVALSFIDTRSADGLYRKYRYVLLGDRGAPRHMVASEKWCVHAADRVRKPEILAEELQYIRGEDPHHDALNRARRVLGLDYVAFDYSNDQQGRLVIWEPNPWPLLWAPFNSRDQYFGYQKECVDRIYTMMVEQYFALADGPAQTARGEF